jgi:hypothetical protein
MPSAFCDGSSGEDRAVGDFDGKVILVTGGATGWVRDCHRRG